MKVDNGLYFLAGFAGGAITGFLVTYRYLNRKLEQELIDEKLYRKKLDLYSGDDSNEDSMTDESEEKEFSVAREKILENERRKVEYYKMYNTGDAKPELYDEEESNEGPHIEILTNHKFYGMVSEKTADNGNGEYTLMELLVEDVGLTDNEFESWDVTEVVTDIGNLRDLDTGDIERGLGYRSITSWIATIASIDNDLLEIGDGDVHAYAVNHNLKLLYHVRYPLHLFEEYAVPLEHGGE